MSITAHPIITEVMNAFRAVPATSRIIGTKPPAKPTARRIRCGGCTHAIAKHRIRDDRRRQGKHRPDEPGPGKGTDRKRRKATGQRDACPRLEGRRIRASLFLFERSRDGGKKHPANGQPERERHSGCHHQTHLPQQHQGDPRDRERDQQPTTSTLERFEDPGVNHASTVGGPGVLPEPGSGPATRAPRSLRTRGGT